MQKHKLILSSCGTSLITNGASEQDRKLINMYANVTKASDIPINALKLLENIISRAERKLLSSNPEQAASLSIELNPIIKLYQAKFKEHKNDHNVLLVKDTWITEKVANVIAKYLISQQLSVEVYSHKDLSTNDIDNFQLSLSGLVSWCDELATAFRNYDYKIVFNSNAGIKNLQGFLQTLSTFYADESIYIFEPTNQLLVLPNVVIEAKELEVFRSNLKLSRRLALQLKVSTKELERFPHNFVLKLKDCSAMTPLGKILWERSKKTIYSQKLWLAPSEKISFSNDFISSVEKLPQHQLILINQTIDKLSKSLESGLPHILKLLDFKLLLANSTPPSTHQLNSWSDKDAKLILAHYDRDVLVLDKLTDKL